MYEDGVLKPVHALDLAEHERVVVVIQEANDDTDEDAVQKVAFMARIRKEMEAYTGPPPSLEEARRILSKVPGSLSEEIIASRGPR